MVYIYRRDKLKVFNIIFILFSLSLIDVFLPGIIWLTIDFPNKPIWFEPLNPEKIFDGVLYYSAFLFLIFIAYYLFNKSPNIESGVLEQKINDKKLIYTLLFLCIMASSTVLYEIIYSGGFVEWLIAKFTLRFRNDLGQIYGTPIGMITHYIPWRFLLITVLYTGQLYRHYLSRFYKKQFYFIYFLAFILTILTSFRGSILLMVFGAAFIEYIRKRFISDVYDYRISNKKTLFSTQNLMIIILGGSLFLTYGYVRDSYVNQYRGIQGKDNNEIYSVINQGSGLEGVSSILHYFNEDNNELMMGKTYIDMLLLPIPRFIYTSKPEWYGIDDITKKMGWPSSTQSAVTMSGEAFANFGYLGIIIAPIYGILFAMIHRLVIGKTAYIVLYPVVIFQLLLVTNWMGFTGFMNALFNSIAIIIIYREIKKYIFIRSRD